jgi:hypothetical protein
LLSPIHAFSFFNTFSDTEKALLACRRLLEMADEIWVFGDWEKSNGCKKEVEWARELGIPVRYIKDVREVMI